MLLTKSVLRKMAQVVNSYFSPLTYSHYLELLNPLWSSHALQALIVGADTEAPGVKTLTLRPGRGWRRHQAGQHIRVAVAVDGMNLTRTYSLSSAPERADGLITITVKTAGPASACLVTRAKVGSYMSISLPQGDFVLPEAMALRPLMLTAGSGITPIMAMLASFDHAGRMPPTVHVHYARRREDVIFASKLQDLAERYPAYRLVVVHTAEVAAALRHFHSDHLARLCPDWRGRDVFVCGPQPLIDSVEAHWRQAGLAYRCRSERFHAVRAALPSGSEGGRVRFLNSQVSAQGRGDQSLLAVAEGQGLSLPHGCRMGICHACDTVIAAGHVRDLRTAQVKACEAGQRIQICVHAAAGDCDLTA